MGYDMQMENLGGDEGYFRANIWDMEILRSAMKSVNVLDLKHADPAWPEVDRKEEESDDDWQERYEAAAESIRSFRSEDENLVPIGKFCSNDGWHVTEEECKLIADALDKIETFQHKPYMGNVEIIDSQSEDMKYIKEFAEYCRKAADNGGFSVW